MFTAKFLIPACILLLAFQACAIPSRAGYDRDRGSYANMPRTDAGALPPDASIQPSSSGSATQHITSDSSWNSVFASWLGTPYRYGGSSRQGTDCSGFVMSAYKEKTGVTLPRSSKAGFKSGQPIEKADLQVGDILYFTNRWGMIDHAAIYIGDNRFIHSSTSKGVVITPMSDPYWERKYKGARRYSAGTTFAS